MSYEGYYRWLCKNGHLHEFDFYDVFYSDDFRCPHCGEGVAWGEGIDTTNGYEGGETKLTVRDSHECKCEKCGVVHHSEPIQYVIPK